MPNFGKFQKIRERIQSLPTRKLEMSLSQAKE
jgi:hypothetical protein|uniref:Uncharacterized protein n=1 Tax=Herelleviridae sp. cttEB8 TaxID=2825832 RepID=A0A8S5P569_9CAUD|nr:MAG TPA: hypothetical protein [Herelleviridae sp. cttEB8]